MKSKKRIVLAYSGGLDTSIILRWLQENYNAEVICYTADIGQEIDRKLIISNAKKFGVKNIIITLGERGVYFANENEEYFIDALKLKDQVVDTTGAGDAFNGAFAVALANDGYSVVITGRREEPLNNTVKEIGNNKVFAITCDVGQQESVKNMFSKTMEKFGRLDVLFNNAGGGAPKKLLEDLTYDDWQKVVDSNLTGTFLCSQEAIKIMKNQNPMGGRIINNGSISAYAPRPDSAPYTATKHGVSGLTKSISLDGRKYNIACSQIDIGNAATPMTERMKKGVPQANGSTIVEPTFDVNHVAEVVLNISNFPLETNVQFITIMATKMPYIGRG